MKLSWENRKMNFTRFAVLGIWLSFFVHISACETTPKLPPLKLVDKVDIPRFMGKWYVIANIPTFIEKGAHNATESYDLEKDGSIAITFRFNKKSSDGPVVEYHPKAFVHDTKSNAEWRVQFLWPFLADYLVIDLADDYSFTVIGVPSRGYLWIMARSSKMDSKTYETVIARIAAQGYDISKIQKVPQS
jgi:apolipoprotein D and lipocalin family protein